MEKEKVGPKVRNSDWQASRNIRPLPSLLDLFPQSTDDLVANVFFFSLPGMSKKEKREPKMDRQNGGGEFRLPCLEKSTSRDSVWEPYVC